MLAMKCGILDLGNGFEDLIVIPTTGDLVVVENLMGYLYVNPITIDAPVGFETNAIAEKMCESFDCSGVALTSEFLITFRGDFAEYRLVSDPYNIVTTVEFDTFCSYDTEGGELIW